MQAYETVRIRRPFINPNSGFLFQLEQYEVSTRWAGGSIHSAHLTLLIYSFSLSLSLSLTLTLTLTHTLTLTLTHTFSFSHTLAHRSRLSTHY